MATALMMVVTGAVFGVMNPAEGTFQAQPEVSDMQQRLRVAASSLYKDLVMGGAGTYSGSAVGALSNFFAPIVPYRIGTMAPDPAAGVFYRPDAISIAFVPTTASQCTIREAMPQPSSEIKVNAQPGCPAGDPLCGFDAGMRVLIFDDGGSWDTFTVTAVQSDALHLQHRDDVLSKAYDVGARIAQVAQHTYWLRSDPESGTFQLMHYDGYQTDLPLVDHLVGFQLEYFGDPQPPALLKPVSDPKGPWTTYGPKPPALGVDNRSDTWIAGENCAFRIDGGTGAQVPRLATLDGPAGSLVRLDPSILVDGPWCPDQLAPSRFDADLLRVRRVRVTLRVQASLDALRGPQGALFTRGGRFTGAERFVPDQEVRFDVTPRNLNLGR
ncbi:MAG: hypothetical protein HYZ58_00260 [Acidobacteria bacterium]|nr:hypothetical protein [Acidobacteriota bacterium]